MDPSTEKVDLRSHYEGYLTGKETNVILQGNSTTIHVDLDEALSKSGLEVLSIHEAISKKEDLLRTLFEKKLVKSSGEKYAAFNNAFFNGGTFIHVPRGVEISSPLRKMLLVKNPATSIIDQTIIYAEEASKLNFLEELYTSSSEKPYLMSSVLEVRAAASSHVDASSLQLLDEKATYLSNKEVHAANDSHVNRHLHPARLEDNTVPSELRPQRAWSKRRRVRGVLLQREAAVRPGVQPAAQLT